MDCPHDLHTNSIAVVKDSSVISIYTDILTEEKKIEISCQSDTNTKIKIITDGKLAAIADVENNAIDIIELSSGNKIRSINTTLSVISIEFFNNV